MAGKDTIPKTLFVSVLLCLVCSILVSGAAVFLKPIQKRNKELDMKTNILAAGGLLEEGKSIDELFSKVKPLVVDLSSGELVTDKDANSFDQYLAEKDPELVYTIEKNNDLAGIKKRAKYAKVYVVVADGNITQLILPLHGKGLWSTMYGFMALESDTTTVKGFAFYAHGETPGLGGEVDNPNWKGQWPGKKIFDSNWTPVIRILKGKVNKNSTNAIHEIDGLSGSTLTSVGVNNLIQYWIGDDGFAKFLENVRNGGIQL